MRQGLNHQEIEAERERQVSSIEKQLIALNSEKQYVENMLNKFPSHTAGRTLAERRQKRETEERLEDVNNSLRNFRKDLRHWQMK